MGNFCKASKLLVAALASIGNGKPLSENSTTTRPQQPASSACGQRPLLEDFDSLGAWFEGVNSINCTSVPRRDNVTIAIVGAGVSGLATGLLLDSVGVHNWEIIEASGRVGGRFRTKFVGGTAEYAEMGPMRLPWSITYKSDNSTHAYTDHRMTFQLADTLNRINGDDPRLRIDFIPWVQHHPNELLARGTGRLRSPSGGVDRVPTRAEVAADPAALAKPPPMDTQEYRDVKGKMNALLRREETLRFIQRDVWRAHAWAMGQGLDDLSEQAWMRERFRAGENVTDAIWTDSDYDVFWDELHHNSNLAQDGSAGALGETEWKCVDGGFDRITEAFVPHVHDRLTLNRKVRKIAPVYDGSGRQQTGTRVSWFPSVEDRTPVHKDYDYAVVAVPFTMTRFMELPPFSSVLGRAISEAGLRFKSACKLALLFSERFWERGPRPIFGGYSQPASNAVGALYYPVYGLNETGRPGLITQYRGGDWSDRFVSLSDDEYAGMVLDAVVSLHGEQARESYTGVYEKLCWLQDQHAAAAWCRPDVEQHRLYIPAYHRTEFNTIFIGEHTAPTHAWISSALHSAVRGTVQLLLELGMVDEAKKVNKEWMGQWIHGA
ncbi:amine oxidase [Cordyceps fumosorosea ARSEF 2679]|uniref:Amine oxidase n=1 Tax=Cordyceps fumosorosea (strain ARSEF 2679) TaxID=1081104 RepID=A0A167NWN1_CORFA|nr:amine oxidase [Cordyceps fumosorosea ARSEF 2679]OAA56024.1 amine oxidase [Cordyceps fumosorosea ARSEF 2679]